MVDAPRYVHSTTFLLTCFHVVSAVLLPCYLNGGPTVTSSAEINASCTNISIVNLSAFGVLTININITSIASANPNVALISATIFNLTLLEGAVLTVDSSGYQISPGNASPRIAVVILNLTARNGAVVVRGRFPSGSSILIRYAQMVVDRSSAPTLASLDPWNPSVCKALFVGNLTLMGGASMMIADTTVHILATGPTCVALYATGKMLIVNTSVFAITSSNFTNANDADNMALVASPLIVEGNSSWSIISSRLAAGSCGIKFDRSPITIAECSSMTITYSYVSSGNWIAFKVNASDLAISNGSLLSMFGSVFSGPFNCLEIDFSAILITASSQWVIASSTLSSGGYDAVNVFESPVLICLSGALVISRSMLLGRRYAFSMNLSPIIVALRGLFEFHSSNFTGLSIAITLSATNITIVNSSTWLVQNSTIRGTVLGGFLVVDANTEIRDGSRWIISDSSVTAGGFGALAVSQNFFASGGGKATSVVVRSNSSWLIERCMMIGSSAAPPFALSSCTVTITNGSKLSIADCYASSNASTTGGISITSATVAVSESSEFVLFRTSVNTLLSSALQVASSSSITISCLSLWNISSCALQGKSAVDVSSRARLEGRSVWTISYCTLFSLSGPGIALSAGMTVATFSVMTIRQCVVTCHAADVCLNAGLVVSSDLGALHLLENNCSTRPTSAASSALFFGSVMAGGGAPAFPILVDRCNMVNGALWMLSRHGYPTATSIQCGRCDAVVDCFWALTTPTTLTKMSCSDDCACAVACGGTPDWCGPGVGAWWPNAVVSGGGAMCKYNSDDSPRIRVSRTVSQNMSLSITATRSYSPRAPATTQNSSPASWRGPATSAAAACAVGVAGAVGAMMVQRITSQQLINDCASSAPGGGADFSSSPLQMHFGPRSRDNSEYVRGTVVGNLLLWTLCCAAGATSAALLLKLKVLSNLARGAAQLRLPGRLFVPFAILLTPTVSSATSLVVGSGFLPSDVALGLAGAACCVCGVAGAFFVTAIRCRQLAIAEPSMNEVRGGSSVPSVVTDGHLLSSTTEIRRCLRRQLLSRVEWVDRRRRGDGRGFVAMWGSLFEAYVRGRPWYCVADSSLSIVSGILSGLIVIDSGNGVVCARLQLAAAVLGVVVLLCLLTLRPYGAKMDERLALGNAFATGGIAVLGFCAIDTMWLTTAQVGLNALSAVVVVAALAAEGYFSGVWQLLSLTGANQIRHLRDGTTRSAQPTVLACERARALESIVRLICERARSGS